MVENSLTKNGIFIITFCFIFIGSIGLTSALTLDDFRFQNTNVINIINNTELWLNNITDVNIPSPSDEEFLQYNSGTGKWISYLFDLADWWDYNYNDLINTPTALSDFSNDLSVSDFPNDNSYYNSTTLTTNSQLLNGNNYWNNTYATFNKTYADTLYAPIGIVSNPFDQSLNTTDNVTFVNITADYFFGDGSQLTGISSGNINGNGSAGYVPYYFNESYLSNSPVFTDGEKVGIGTSSPGAKLEVSGNISSNNYIYSNYGFQMGTNYASPEFRFLESGTEKGRMRWDGTNDLIGFRTGTSGDDNFVIKSGNVGIGTTTPSYKLDVAGNVNAYDVMINGTSLTADSLGAVTGSGTAMRVPLWNSSTSLNDSNIYQGLDGYIGIGITNPSQNLHVSGTTYSSQVVGAGSSVQSPKYTTWSSSGDLTFEGRNGQDLIFETNLTNEVMRIDSATGNVGIGTGLPTQGKLVVVGNSYFNGHLQLVDGYGFKATSGLSGYYIGSPSAGELKMRTTSNDNVLVLKNSGNVGIGTASPTRKLDVYDGVNDLYLMLQTDKTDGIASIYYQNDNQRWETGVSSSDLFRIYDVGTYKPVMQIEPGNTAEVLRIDDSGNVGIGTSSPNSKLDIRGALYIGENSNSVGRTEISSSSNNGYMFIRNNAGIAKVALQATGDSYFNGGNVGIGTTTPNQLLHVEGNANITGTVYYGSLQANSPILYFTDDDFTVEIKKATNGNYYLEYVNENLTTQREWVNCLTATTWYQTEACAKLETTALRHEMENNGTNTYETGSFQNITYYNNVSSEIEVCEEVLINGSWEETIYTNETYTEQVLVNESWTEYIYDNELNIIDEIFHEAIYEEVEYNESIPSIVFHEAIYEIQCNNETIYTQEPYEVEEIVNTTKKLTPYEYVFNWVTKTAETILDLFYNNLEDWEPNTNYEIGDVVEYEGIAYEVIQSHTSQSNWLPTQAHSLYSIKFYVIDQTGTEIIEEWVQPTGASDAYNIGDLVSYNGNTYESLINGNVWSPSAYPAGWELIN